MAVLTSELERELGGRQKMAVAAVLGTGFLLVLKLEPMAIPMAILLGCAWDLVRSLRHRKAYRLIAVQALIVALGATVMAVVIRMPYGPWMFLCYAIAISLTDAAAQVGGRRWGKKETFFSSLSPNKSIQGAATSWAVGSVVVFALGTTMTLTADSLPGWFMPALVMAPVASTFGDLLASTVKRAVGIKDFGRYLGKDTGGLMDRVDSWVAVFSVVGVAMVPFLLIG